MTALRDTLYLGLIVCLLTAALGPVGCRSDGVRVRSWDEAIAFARAELAEETAQNLEVRLEGYARSAANLSAEIEALDQARPALEAIGRLRGLHVPLVGDGWQILLALLSLVTVDGAKIIARLEATLSELVELKDSLDGLSRLPDVAGAVRAFRAAPTRHTLAALADASAEATPAMGRLQADLEVVIEPLDEVAGGLGGLVKGLRSVARANVPAVSDAAGAAAEGIAPIEEPLLALRDGLSRLQQEIGADRGTLENIQEAVRQAREHEE